MKIIDVVSLFFLIIVVILKYIVKFNEKDRVKNFINDFFDKHYKKIWIFYIIILFFSVIYRFGEYPYGILVDEAGMAYDAISIANFGVDRYLNSFPLYLINFGGGQSVLCCYLAVIFIKIFGANIISYRLPMLIIYLFAVICSYLFVSRFKNKKVAMLFLFLIITCPWNIVSTRVAIDCNLYAGMLMIDLYLMHKASKSYQYIIAGIFVGITLYTYCLTWITLPIFLGIWAIYMLYIKKIKFKQLCLFALPIFILAIPLIYFLLLNNGIFTKTQFGVFTIPKVYEFRQSEVALSNVWTKGLESIKVIFGEKNTIYPIYIPLFIIGYILSFFKVVESIKNKKYNIDSIFVFTFTSILIGLLFASVPTANKANALYILIMYFVAIGIIEICKKFKIALLGFIVLIIVLFLNFEYEYYVIGTTDISIEWYEDISYSKLINRLEDNKELEDINKYVMLYKTQPYIYQILESQISPIEFDKIKIGNYYGEKLIEITKVGKYNYCDYFYKKQDFLNKDYKNEDCIIIVSREFFKDEDVKEKFDNINFKKIEFEDLYIFMNSNSKINLNI